MDLNSLLSVLGAMGGFKAVEWLVTFWSTRKVNERKEDAAVDGIENENERKQVAWLEERISQRDAKIDALYIELRQEQADKLAYIHKLHEKELEYKEAEIKRCDLRGCNKRQPPSDY